METALSLLTAVLIPVGIWGGLLVYPPLQFKTVRKLRGIWRVFAVLPLLPMAFVLIVTIRGFYYQSNLWPILLIFTAPIALLYLLALTWIHRVVMQRKDLNQTEA
jgi:hypothetical protein